MSNEYLDRYIEYTSEFCDAPTIMQTYGALSVLSAICTQRDGYIYLPFGDERLYPNLWIMLIAPSSVYRKTKCLHIARRFVVPVLGQRAVMPQDFTKEGILKHMQERPTGIIFWGEAAGMIAAFGRDYMAGTMELLTDIYDNPPLVERVLASGLQSVHEPRLTILSASTMQWLEDSVSASSVTGGFFARFLFCFHERKEKCYAIPPNSSKEKFNRIVLMLSTLRSTLKNGQGMVEMSLSPEATSHYEGWYYGMENRLKFVEGSDPRKVGVLSAFASRLSVTALKTACLLQSVSGGTEVISLENLKLSCDLINRSFNQLDSVLFDSIMASKFEKKKLFLLQRLRETLHLPYRDALRYSHLSKYEFDAVLDTLVAEGLCERADKLIIWKGEKV